MHNLQQKKYPTDLHTYTVETMVRSRGQTMEHSLMTIPPWQPSHASAAARKELFLDTDAMEKKPRQEP
nr:hypothetical protein [Tanacetum cinerariifolium]